VDAGALAEGRRFEPGTSASGALLTRDGLVAALAAA
jgi:predicted dinucleotide-binding enzyme